MPWEIEPGTTAARITVTTSGLVRLRRSPTEFSGGIVYIVSGLKTYVETGAPLSVPAEVG